MRAYQMPYRDLAAIEVSPRLFRKQILKACEIPYDGERLRFDRDYLARAVDSFKAGAYDQVPFVLADGENRHSVAPERFHGEVKALELNGDAIDALIELTEEGAAVVRKNPKLGVSARLVPDLERDGRIFPVAVEHVCGTLNPRVSGLHPWEAVSVRSLSQSSRQEVIDLTQSQMADKTFTQEHLEKLNELPEDQRARVTALLEGKAEPQKSDPAKPEANADEADESKLKAGLKKIFGIKPDEELDWDAEYEKLLADLDKKEPDPAAPEKEPVASLSDADRRAIDLARTEAASARKELNEERWRTQREKLAKAGVPPAMLDLAEPVMKDGPGRTINLSDGKTPDSFEIVSKLLDQAKGFVDLSDPFGSQIDESEENEAKDLAKRWKENPA